MSVTAFCRRARAREGAAANLRHDAPKGASRPCDGGRVFGYDNVEVRGPDGTRSHVERRINEAEASVVRRIFGMSAGGSGLTAIAKALNIDGVPTPRPQRGRPAAWIASSVRAVLIDPSIAER
jgi:hypothetical protein